MNTIRGEILEIREILKELKEKVSTQEELVTDKMKLYFGNEPKYIIFISISDGKSRAYVSKGIGNSIDTSWKNATDIMNKRIKELELNPIWIKADIVKEINEYPYDSFMEYASKFKPYCFREGISFDKMFNDAFMEQEVNANSFIDEVKDPKSKYIIWKRINSYIQNNRGLKYTIEESSVKNMYTFTTTGFFHDGYKCYNLNNEMLNNGRRCVEKLDEELLYLIIEKSSGYLANQVESTGKFCYGYYPCFNKEMKQYNILRHAGTIYSMIEGYEVTKDTSLKRQIDSALDYMFADGIELYKGIDGVTRAFVVDHSHDNEIKLGGNAIAILTLSKYTTVFDDNKYIQVMEELAEGVEFFQSKHDGSFVHVLNYEDLSVKERNRIIYYDGEAAFALIRLYDIDKNERWLNIVERAFSYFIQKEYWRNHDHWLSYCSNELVKYKPDKKYFEFNFQNVNGILDASLTRERPQPNWLELLMATYGIVEKMKQHNYFPETLASFDQEKLIKAIEYRVENQLNSIFFPEVAMYFEVPENILWAFHERGSFFRTRIDDVQHSISGYCSYLNQIVKNS